MSFLGLLPRRHRHVFEFRHASWFGQEALDLLRRHDVAFCVQDMPDLDCPAVVTGRIAYVRMHGVGRAYSGSYSDKALQDWARKLRSLATDGVEAVWVYFNNDQNANAPANAATLREKLQDS